MTIPQVTSHKISVLEKTEPYSHKGRYMMIIRYFFVRQIIVKTFS